MKRIVAVLLILVVLAGVFDSCMDIRRDDVPTFLADWFGSWFVGGNANYSLPIWGPYDFWHFSKSCLMGCWALIASISFIAGYRSAFFPGSDFSTWMREWWKPVALFFALYWIEGLIFALFYHMVWRI
jgi:hypothetical protein